MWARCEWTPAARAAILAQEYRYISPVFTYTVPSGEITRIVSAALTNTPALDGMEPVVAHALADNLGGANGDLHVPVRRGCFALDNSASTDALTRADVGKTCYIATITPSPRPPAARAQPGSCAM
jgi:hypothetical protein